MTFDELLEWTNSTAYSEPESEHHNAICIQMMRWMDRALYPPRSGLTIDIGSGSGVVLNILGGMGFTGLIGTNLLDEDADSCVRNGICCWQEDMHRIASSSWRGLWKRASLVTARHILEHSPAPALVLRTIWSLVPEGCGLYVEVPAPGTAARHEYNPNHWSVLSRTGWAALIEKCGFEIVDQTIITLTIPAGEDAYYAYAARKMKS